MANTTLTADVVGKTALAILENELGVLKTVHRVYEDEFANSVNGYKIGDTLRIRRPADFTLRTGPTLTTQDVIEGRTTLTIDQQVGVDFQFSSTDLTLKIEDLSERVIKPAMSTIINGIARDVFDVMYKKTYNWVGTAGQTINSFADFAVPAQRMDEMAIPQDMRYAALHPADHWGLLGSQTALYIQGAANSAYREGELGKIGGIDTRMSQVLPTHTNGTWDATTPLTDGNSQEVTYDTAKNTWTQTLVTDGWDASATITAGSVFTIENVFMVNPKTKVSTGQLQQFVVTTAVTANATTTADTNLTISPPIIVTGPHQTVTYSGNFDGRAITPVGAPSTAYRQNLFYHKNAMALAMVPMELPSGAFGASRQTYKGMSVRVIPVYDGANDISKWRLDVLYGRELIDPRLSVRSSGTS
jgi:hypothetical protein